MKKHLLKHFCAVFLAGFMALLLLPQAAQAQGKKAYVVKSSDKKTLTFYYDTKKSSRTGTVWGIEETKEEYGNTYTAWSGTYSTPESEVTTVVFDASFKDYHPKSTEKWFVNFVNLEKIDGLTKINTSEVTTMTSMFAFCKKLTQLDLSNFNTENVTSMCSMFFGCPSLSFIDVSKFKTEKVIDMYGMFYGCSSLSSIDVSKFNTAKVTGMYGMFSGCSSLSSIDVSNFNTEKVTNMNEMFYGCNSLTTIYCNNTWTCAKSKEMFYNCAKLKGAVTFDASKIDVSMANPNTGYFTKKKISGITTITNNNASIKAIYSTDGKRLNELQHGLNIVRMSNGTTQKVLRK